MIEKSASKIAYLLLGLSVGSLVGILFAPKSGRETRKYLVQKAREASEYAQVKAREKKELAEDLIRRGKEAVTQKRKQIAAAIDVGRETYQRAESNAPGPNGEHASRSI